MKKYLLITICATLILYQAQAQEGQDTLKKSKPEKMTNGMGVFGVRFMPTISSLNIQNNDGIVQADFIWTLGYGGLFGYNFNNNIGLEFEVIYNKLSQKYKDHELDRRIDINYINIPLLFSLNTDRKSAVNMSLVGGPQLGINVGSNVTTTGIANGSYETQAVLAVKQNDFGVAYGAGLDFALNSERTFRFDLGFRGVFGLIDISDDSGTIETDQYYILRKGNIETYSLYFGFTFLL